MITIADIRARFPEVSDDVLFPDARIQLFIDDAALFIGDCFGDKYTDLAHSYLTMHLLALSENTKDDIEDGAGGGLGAMNAATVGKVSYSRAINNIDQNHPDASYLSTSYGQQFLHIRRTACPCGMMII